MKAITLLIVVYFLSCNNQHTSDTIVKEISKDDSLKSELIGKWGGDEKAPTWDIVNDSIYYYDTSSPYHGWHPYKIINSDFVIYFNDHTGVLMNTHVVKDTMFFYDPLSYGAIIQAFRK